MIAKVTNKVENFYQYMGRFFGSRLVQSQINDRIYDDDNKEWYIYLEKEKVTAFVSISNNIIKNIYTIKPKYLEAVLNTIQKENKITYSVVPSCYADIYEKCGFKISSDTNLKNFVTIFIEDTEAIRA